MKEHEITVGERTFTFYSLKPFDIIKHGARLKAALTRGVTSEGLDANVVQLLAGLDEKFVPEIVMPILKECGVVCTSAAKRVTTETEVNEIYTEEDIDEFFELIFMVLAANFGPMVKKTLARFGVHLDKLDLKKVIANLSKLPSETTSPKK